MVLSHYSGGKGKHYFRENNFFILFFPFLRSYRQLLMALYLIIKRLTLILHAISRVRIQ